MHSLNIELDNDLGRRDLLQQKEKKYIKMSCLFSQFRKKIATYMLTILGHMEG